MESSRYNVRLDAFEGPLDLLLHLVKSNEVDIYHLPISTITDQYLEYLDLLEEMNLDVAGEYLVMAATLMYLKSRLLLPVEEEEDEDEDDPAVDLVRQLAEYKRYREASDELRDRALLDRDVFRRPASPPASDDRKGTPGEDAPGFADVELGDLFEALRRTLLRAAARKPHTLEPEQFSVADAVRTLVDRLRGTERMEFGLLFPEGSARGYIIATFIGLLELMKMDIIDAEQDGDRGAIYLRLTSKDFDDSLVQLVETYGSGGTFKDWEKETGDGQTEH